MFSKKLGGALALFGATAIVPIAVAQEVPAPTPEPVLVPL